MKIINENRLRTIVRESIKSVLSEGYLDDIYSNEKFMNWFKGSKIVDKNGKPLLLGHATRSFGFNKFNTPFIHLSSINDASFFSGGNKRLFKFKNTLNKLSPEEIVDLYNNHFAYNNDNKYYLLDDGTIQKTINAYEAEIKKCNSVEYAEEMKRYGIDAKKSSLLAEKSYSLFQNLISKNKILYFTDARNGIPRLSPMIDDDISKKTFDNWIRHTFVTLSKIKEIILNRMFEKDNYAGKGGTYALCARVINPLVIDCQGRLWDDIYLTPQNCNGYSEIFDKYTELGYNTKRYGKGSWIGLDNESIAFLAKKTGYDGVIFHNIREGMSGETGRITTYIVFSSKQLKSPYENDGNFGDTENIFK